MSEVELPRRFLYTRNHTFVGKLAKTNAANTEIAHIAIFPTATKTASDDTTGKFGLFGRASDD